MNTRRGLPAFTLIEMLIVIAIIATLAALIVPISSRALERSRRASCASQLKQLGMVLQQYAEDHRGLYPSRDAGGGFWTHQIYPGYLDVTNLLICPTEARKGKRTVENTPGPVSTYWYGAGDVVDAGGAIVTDGYFQFNTPKDKWMMCDYWYTDCHENGKNALFFDGRVEFVPVADILVNTGEFPAP